MSASLAPSLAKARTTSRSEMMPMSAPWASQTGKAPMLSALKRVQIDAIDSSGMQV